MSAPFVQQLRAARPPIMIGGVSRRSGESIAFRAEASDIWEAVRVIALPGARVAEMKQSVVAALFPDQDKNQFVLKLRGWEILDENTSLAEAGIGNGSIVLIAYRRRRPVR